MEAIKTQISSTDDVLQKAQKVIDKHLALIKMRERLEEVKKERKYTNKVYVYHRFEDIEKERLFPVMESCGHIAD